MTSPRASGWSRWSPPEPSLKEVRERVGAAGVSGDEFLLRCFLRPDEIATMKAAGSPQNYLTASRPLATLIQQLTMRPRAKFVRIQRDGFSLTLQKR